VRQHLLSQFGDVKAVHGSSRNRLICNGSCARCSRFTSHLSDDKLEQKVPGTTKRNIREPPGTWMAWAVAELGGRLLEI
jgi:hypothetical protein